MILKLPWPPSSTHLPRLPHLRRLFHSTTDTSFIDASSIFHYAIKSCSGTTSLATSHLVHARLIRTGLVSSRFLQNHLLNAYFKCDALEDARRLVTEIEYPNVFTYNAMIIGYGICNRLGDAEKVFDEMPERDPVSWSSMLSACFRNGKPEKAVRLFVWMVGEENGRVPDQHSVTCVMKAAGRIGFLGLAIQVHGFVEKFGFGDVSEVCASLIDMYIKCGAVGLAERVFRRVERPSLFCLNSMLYGYSILSGIRGSLDFFHRMEQRDVVSWHTIISLLSQHGSAVQALEMFVEMSFQGFRTNSETYASVLSACTDLNDWDWGRHLHARIVRSESSLDMYTGSGFIDMYAKWGFIKSARWIFDSLKNPNVVSWTSLIAGVAQFGNADEALMLFNCMRGANFKPDDYVVATVFGACSSDEEFYYLGKQLHGFSVKSGTESSIPVGNALITMYSKGGNVREANSAFDSMPQRDIISWTSMITAYSQSGDVHRARAYFDKMPHRNIVSWTSMLGAYVQQGFWEEGLNFYVTMLRQGIKPDCVTFATSLSACADSVLLQLGKQIIGQAEKFGHSSDIAIANCYITLYSRSGLIHEAEIVFDSLHTKNLVSWNSMLSGYAQNGYPRRVIDLYEGMISAGCTPDGISYLSVLMACSHAGLVLQGRHYFDSMMKNHSISPAPEHYTCMVDLLGRAGLIEQAKDLVDTMPFEPNATVLSALLSACRNCLNTELAEFAMRKLHELDADDSGVYVLLSNAFMDSGKLEGVMNTRKMMREKGISKILGCSWIEVHGKTHVFSAEDTNHPQIEEVFNMLECVISKMDDDSCCSDMESLVEPV